MRSADYSDQRRTRRRSSQRSHELDITIKLQCDGEAVAGDGPLWTLQATSDTRTAWTGV